MSSARFLRTPSVVFDVAAAVVPVAEVKLASESTELGQTLKCGNEVVRSPNFLKAIF